MADVFSPRRWRRVLLWDLWRARKGTWQYRVLLIEGGVNHTLSIDRCTWASCIRWWWVGSQVLVKLRCQTRFPSLWPYYTRRVKEAIHISLHPNNINRASGIEILEAWMPTIKKHNNRRAVLRTTEGANYSWVKQQGSKCTMHQSELLKSN